MSARPTLHIGGRDVPAGGVAYDVVDPSTEQIIASGPEATSADIDAAVSAARAASAGWSSMSPRQRSELLHAWADAIDREREHLIALNGAEMGGALGGAPTRTVLAAAELLRTYADRAFLDLGESFAPRPGFTGLLSGVARRIPLGVVAVFGSYNAPLLNIVSMAGPALVTGNTVVVKPPAQNPLTTLELVRLATEAGLPSGVVNSVAGRDPAVGAGLVAHPGVDGVGFTGSPAVGIRIAQSAAAQLKPVLLELGGKGACIVLDDADLDVAVEILDSTWLFHSGQACGAPTRAIVHESLRDALTERLVALARGLRVGPGADPATQVGPVIDAAQRERIERYVASAVREGATVAIGGERPDLDVGFYAAPTLLTDCTPEMTAVREEIFGPVITVLAVRDDEEAIAVANDSDYGLVNYVVSRDTRRAFALAQRLESGVVSINTLQSAGNGVEEMPFGGRKHSGFGRKGGVHGLEAFTQPQGIVVRA